MAISPENAIQQLRDAFPDKYKFATDEEVYRIARNKYPDAPIQDWQKIGYKSIPKIKEDPFDVNLERTDETTFLDHFNIYGIDEDSSYLARLAYTRSLQGMASDVLRGKPKFTFDEQPSLFSEAIAGIMAFAMPLDALSLFGGGGIFGKAVLSTGGAKAATKYLSKKVLKVAPGMAKAPGGRAAVESSIRNIIGSEMMYVPYEGAKANMFARTEHMRNPDIDPLSSQDILKETFAGIVHGGIMGVMGGSTRPFLAARHSRLLKTIDNFEAQKKLTGASQGRLLKLKDKLKYTGAYSQYATDVAGLTLGDITGTAVAYGQIKSGEEMMASLLTMGGFAGATRVAGLGLNKVVMEPLEKAQSEYKKKFEIRKKQLDKEEAIQNSVNSKSKEQLDTDAEQQATQNSFENMSDLDDRRKAFDESEAGMRFKEIENKVKAFKELADDDIDDPKKALKFYEKRMEMFAEVKDYLEGAEVMFDDVVRLEKWMDEGLENATKSLGIQRGSIADNISTRITQIRTRLDKAGRPDTIPIELADGTFKDTPIMNIQDELSKKGLSGDELNQEFLRILDSTEETLAKIPEEGESKKLVKRELDYVKTTKSIQELESGVKQALKDNKNDLSLAYKNTIDYVNKIDKEIDLINNDNSLSANQKATATANLQLLKRVATDDDFILKTGEGGSRKGQALLKSDNHKIYFKTMFKFVQKMRKANPGLKITELGQSTIKNYVSKLSGTQKSGMAFLYETIDVKKQLMPVGDAGIGVKGVLFKQKKIVDAPPETGLKKENISEDGLDIVTGKNIKQKKVPFTDTESSVSGNSINSLISNIKKIIKKVKYKVKDGKGKLNDIMFFAQKRVGKKNNYSYESVALGQGTFTKLSQAIFGIDGSKFRKGFYSYITETRRGGATNNDALIVEVFGLGHDPAGLTPQGKAYMNQIIEDKSGRMLKSTEKRYKQLMKEYFDKVYDKTTSKQIEQMAKNKAKTKLQKYNLIAESLEDENVSTIYSLKKGFERLEGFKKLADKDGFINFTDAGEITKDINKVKFKIHKDVLEGSFRINMETNSRINELFAGKNEITKIPYTKVEVAFQSKALESLMTKLNLGATLDNPLKDVKLEEINIEYQSRDKLRKNALTKNSTDNLNTLKVKTRLVMTGGRFGDFSRMALGDAKYEKQLKSVLKTYGMTDADIKKMKKISLEDDMVDEAILTRILNDMECR